MTFKLGNQAKTWGSAALFFLVTTVLCGVIYTAACTGLAQLFFPHQANGSIIEVDGTKYGSELVGQRFTEMGNKPIPSDLVTNSGSGFDPHISPAAAEYQVDRLARTTGKSASEIRDIIKQCTEQPQFGFLGDARVNVLKVNLMLDGVL